MSDPAMALSADATPHFVLKKGHRGRYRFTLIVAGNRLTGEVNTMNGWSSRSAQDTKALSEIGALAESLVAAIKAHPTILEPHLVIPDEQSEDPVTGSPSAQIDLSETRIDGAEPDG